MALRRLWAEFKAFAFKGNMIDLAVAVVIGGAFSGVIDSLVKDVIMPSISYATAAVKDAKNAAVDVAGKAGGAVGLTAAATATQPATQQATAGTGTGTQPTTAPATAAIVDPPIGGSTAVVADQMIAASGEAKSQAWRDMTSAFATALAADRKAADDKAALAAAAAERKAAEDKPVDLSWKIGRINIGNFLAAMINFVIIALAVFLIIVKLLGGVMKRAGGTPAPEEPTTRECPECLSIIPVKAKRCPNCTTQLAPNATPTV